MIAELGRAVEELRAEVAELRRRRAGNGAAAAPAAAPASSQGGAAMSWARPDQIVDYRPAGACDGCGADLAGAVDLGVARSFQQVEVPLLTARRIQHDLHRARCGCGKAPPQRQPGQAADITARMIERRQILGPY